MKRRIPLPVENMVENVENHKIHVENKNSLYILGWIKIGFQKQGKSDRKEVKKPLIQAVFLH